VALGFGGRDVPSIAKWALKNTDCSAFAGSNGKAPFGQIGRLAEDRSGMDGNIPTKYGLKNGTVPPF
jgi:hypothetical protein